MHEGRGAHADLDVRTLLLAVRPWSFTMTAISVSVGSLIALPRGDFHLGLYMATLIGMILAHGATNLINDYYDVRSGVDQPDAPTARYRPHPLVEGTLTPRQVMIEALTLYAAAAFIGVYLAMLRGWPIVALALVGGLASFTYTASPIEYKHRGLGELSVFLMWGPLMTLGAYYVQTGSWSGIGAVLWASLPIGLWVALVLLANNLKDIDYDRRMGINTLGTALKRSGTLRLYVLMVIAIYLLSGVALIVGALPLWSLLVFVSIPKAVREIQTLRHAPEIPADADPRTAQLSTLYGLLLVISLLLGRFLPLS